MMKKRCLCLLFAALLVACLGCKKQPEILLADPPASTEAAQTEPDAPEATPEAAPAEETAAPAAAAIETDLTAMQKGVGYDADMDGDGQLDRVQIEYYENGDEAYDAIDVSVQLASGDKQSYGIYPGYLRDTEGIGGYLLPLSNGTTAVLVTCDAVSDYQTYCVFYRDGELIARSVSGQLVRCVDGVLTIGENNYSCADGDFQKIA